NTHRPRTRNRGRGARARGNPSPREGAGAPARATRITRRRAAAMNLYAAACSAGLSFLFLTLVFRPLEVVFPAKPGQRYFRPAWFLDLCFFLGQYLLWGGLVLLALSSCRGWLDVLVPQAFRQAVASQSWWLQAIEVVLLSDFFVYWGHRLQ